MWFSVGRFAPLLLWWAGVLCCRVVDKLTGVFWWWGGVVCTDRELEWRFKWSLETAVDFVRCVAIFAHDVRKRRVRAMEGEWAQVADGVDNTDKIQAVS